MSPPLTSYLRASALKSLVERGTRQQLREACSTPRKRSRRRGAASHVGTLKPYDPAIVADPTRFDQIEPVTFIPTRNAGRFYFADQMIRGFGENDVGRTLFSNENLSPRTAFSDVAFAPAAGRVVASQVTANAIEADVEAASRTFLVLAVTRHKYWSAMIDGSPAILHPANVAFQGLVIEPGRHHIELRYENPVVIACGWISIAALLLTLFAALRSKGSPSPSPH